MITSTDKIQGKPKIVEGIWANLSWVVKGQKKLYWTWPLLFFGFLTAFFTFPLVFNFTTAVPGAGVEDRLQNLWNFWWVGKALTTGNLNPFLTDRLFFPYYQLGQNRPPLPLYFHDLQLFNGVVTLPFQLLTGKVVVAYNLVVFGATFISGVATFWLVRRLGGSTAGATIAGAIYAFSPIRLNAIAQSITNIQSTEFLPLYAFFLISAAREPGPGGKKKGKGLPSEGFHTPGLAGLNKKIVGGAVLSLVACIYTDWYNTIYLLAFSLVYFGWLIFRPPFTLEKGKTLAKLMGLVGFFSLVLAVPLLVPSILNLNNPDFKIVPGFDRELKSSLKLFSSFLPGENGVGPGWGTCGLGYGGLLLASIAVLSLTGKQVQVVGWSRSNLKFWLAVAISSTVMALGPQLQFSNTFTTNLPLPYALFRLLPVVSVTRDPSRFLILAMLGVAVMAAFAVDWLSTSAWLKRLLTFPSLSFSRRVPGILFSALVIVFLIIDLWSPLPLYATKNNPFLEKLAGEPGDFNLLELPITRHYNHDQVRMFNQIAHGKPILGGYLSRPVVDPYRSPASPFAPISGLVVRQKRIPLDIIPGASNEEVLTDLVYLYNFRYIVLYLQEFSDQAQLYWNTSLVENSFNSLQSVYQDEQIAVYRVPDNFLSPAGGKIHWTLGTGWSGLEQNKKERWRWSSSPALVYATTPVSATVDLKFQIRSYQIEKSFQLKLNGREVYSGQVKPDQLSNISFQLKLPPGRNTLEFGKPGKGKLLDPNSQDGPGEARRDLSFAVSPLEIKETLNP